MRYPGGKNALADFVKAIFRANALLDGAYVEPYAGGASVALGLLFEEYASTIHLNDVDPAVYAFWSAVLEETDALCKLIRDTPITAKEWLRQRLSYQRGADQPALSLGFSTFFLNRTNRSGIIASGGMIGGRAQRGKWKLDARFNRVELIQRIEKIARYRDRIRISNLDAIAFLQAKASKLPRRALVYLDPPYYVKGQERLYANYYSADDHRGIAEFLSGFQIPWLVSYDDAPAIRRLYREYRRMSYRLSYVAANRGQGKEVMFFSPSIEIPERAHSLIAPNRAA